MEILRRFSNEPFFLPLNLVEPVEDTYRTIAGKAEGLYKEKGSRFLAFGFPVASEAEIKTILASLHKEYHDARHICYAYRLGESNFRYRTHDDGEPSGTAGKPIYGQILSHNLTQILIAVVRYFGGTLLGTGGLIQAYRSASADMLSHAGVVEKTVAVTLSLTFPYPLLNDVMKAIKEESATLLKSSFDTRCEVLVSVRKSKSEKFTRRISAIDPDRCSISASDPDVFGNNFNQLTNTNSK